MKVFLWYKCKILKNSKFKMLMVVFIALAVILIQSLFRVKAEVIFPFYGMSVTLLLTYALFTVGDLLRIPYFIAFGKRVTDLWKANILFHLLVGYAISFGVELVYVVIAKIDLEVFKQGLINGIFIIPFTAAMIGLSTIHFRNYSKGEVYAASVFSILNALFFLLPILINFLNIPLESGFYRGILLLGAATLIVLAVFMQTQNYETLVLNLKKEVGLYDKSILLMNEE